jgi:branched-chain amino acid transport system permease protein
MKRPFHRSLLSEGVPVMAQLAQRIQTRGFTFDKLITWFIGSIILIAIMFGLLQTLLSGQYTTRQWFNFFIFGIAQGGVYALIALGYTMVYGILGFINFAHGEVFMAGAFISYFAADFMNRTGFWNAYPLAALLIALMVAMGASTIVAVLLERIAYRPLRDAPRLQLLITSIGASFFLQYAFRSLFGAAFKTYPRSEPLQQSFSVFGTNIFGTQLVIIVAALLMMAGLYLFVEKTKTGKSIRAVAEDKEIAALMGIDVNRVVVITFAIGGMMAGAAGLLFALAFSQVYFLSGFFPGIKAFTAAVLGGIGNIPGAMLGGIVLGVVESFGPLVMGGLGVSSPHQLKDMVAFVVLILVLTFRPTGLLGERLSEEKA